MEVIGAALDSWARTFRLCLILAVASVPACAAAVVAVLIHHVLLRGFSLTARAPEGGEAFAVSDPGPVEEAAQASLVGATLKAIASLMTRTPGKIQSVRDGEGQRGLAEPPRPAAAV